jgi:succinate-semialdehyde dehydrogenase/glutarate-semialdehyde dehydrogenase
LTVHTPTTFTVFDPATEEPVRTVVDAGRDDALAALAAASSAQPELAAMPPQQRADILARAEQRLLDREDELSRLITTEMGKPLAEARGEVRYAAQFLRWFAEEAVRVRGDWQHAPDGRTRLITTLRPVGVCLLVTPWNFPLAMAARKVAPAIAAGCTSVLKPSELTPLSSLALAEILDAAGLPSGGLEVVTTTTPAEAIEPLLDDPRLRKLSFTGSTAVGRHLLGRAGRNVLRVSMELGGNAPFIVLDDADLDEAVAGALVAKLRNGGQACTAANRFLVHERVVDDFTARLSAAMDAVVVGPGDRPGVGLGPLIDARAVAKVSALVDDAVDRGARLRTGGRPLDGRGHFYPPTVLTDVPADAALNQTEIFGPVAAICAVGDDEEAVARANETIHGLAAYLYTRDLGRATRMTETLASGMIGLNTGIVSNPAAPFGGIRHSGLGREGGATGILEYLDTTYVNVAA